MESLKSWQEEKRSAYLYRALAKIETNPIHKNLFLELSQLAEKQATIWEEHLKKEHVKIPENYHPDLRTRLITWLVQCFGAKSLRVALAAMKVRGMSIYQAESPDYPLPPIATQTEEHKHRGVKSGNNLRAAVFGVSDGLISNASLILGVAGASVNHSFILVSGIAGLLAGACSMGAGEYVSVAHNVKCWNINWN